MMNMFIYTENGDLHIRKPNGLEYCFNNTDKPNLGFEYDVVIYDDEEFKIVKWQDDVPFEEQVKENLSDIEIDAIEQYIDNSEAPAGVSLASQYSDTIWNVYIGLIEEIQNTREDVLPDYNVFSSQLPRPHAVPNI